MNNYDIDSKLSSDDKLHLLKYWIKRDPAEIQFMAIPILLSLWI